jgi:hypothetical protein
MSEQSFTLNQAIIQTGQRAAEGSRVYQQAKSQINQKTYTNQATTTQYSTIRVFTSKLRQIRNNKKESTSLDKYHLLKHNLHPSPLIFYSKYQTPYLLVLTSLLSQSQHMRTLAKEGEPKGLRAAI